MSPAPLGLLDLSVVTDLIIDQMKACRDSSPLWNPNNLAINPGPPYTININGLAPEEVRTVGDCELSFYLFHVAQDKNRRNVPPVTPVPPNTAPILFVPLALDLYYLLTAYSKGNYVQEQQAMSIAMRCLHEHPIFRTTVMVGGQPVKQEFTVSMEMESTDELSRLWQSVTAPMRLSATYKVSVVLISPEASGIADAAPVKRIGLSVDPTALPFVDAGQVIGTFRTVRYHSPKSTAATPDFRSYDLSPATVSPGPNQTMVLYGAGLGSATSDQVYLVFADGSEANVTVPWVGAPVPAVAGTRVSLTLPPAVAVPPAGSPEPGVYQLRVGNNVAFGSPGAVRSNTTPFSVAARVDATDPPVLSGAGPFTLNGAGFLAGMTEVLLDTIPLGEGVAGPGGFSINGTGTAVTFTPPTGMAAGLYSVRIRVRQVESDPAWWLTV